MELIEIFIKSNKRNYTFVLTLFKKMSCIELNEFIKEGKESPMY